MYTQKETLLDARSRTRDATARLLRRYRHRHIGAVVVGLLLAALYDPVWTSAILSASDFSLAIAAFTLLVFWKTPAWLMIILTARAGWALHARLML